MVMACGGMAKVAEECCELGQVAAKAVQAGALGCYHWSGDLRLMAEAEMADVLAAIEFAIERNNLDMVGILARKRVKLAAFRNWDKEE